MEKKAKKLWLGDNESVIWYNKIKKIFVFRVNINAQGSRKPHPLCDMII
jgi:hypothetical protein